jgi:hypothetical protein
MNNLRNEYNKALMSSPNLYKEISLSQLAITNPESYPDVSNPFVHNLTLIPFMAGNVARSIPNTAAPINVLMGATTYSSKISQGYDRLKDLYFGKGYVRPKIGMPPIREVTGHYGFGGSKAPYGDAIIPTSINMYREQKSTNLYSPNSPKVDYQGVKEYTELGYDSSIDKIDYKKLFKDDLGNKMFQQPIAIAKGKNKNQIRGGNFFSKGSVKVHGIEDSNILLGDKPIVNLSGVIDFDSTAFSSIEAEVFFPFVVIDLRTKMGILIRPLSEEFPKDQLNITVDEDTYIGRVGTIPRWKNTGRKVSLNFFIIAESEKELPFVQDKINFLKNLCYPAYKQQQTDTATSVNLNLISTSPVVEIRYGDYLYDAGSVGVAHGLVGMISSFEADPFRFPWEVKKGSQLPEGYRCTMEAIIISRENPGVRISDDGTVQYTKFYEIKSS